MIASIVEWFKELIEGIKDRFRNPFTDNNSTPFAGAFMIALIIYNWELLYSILTFEDGVDRLNRIAIIKSYLAKHTILERIGHPLWIAFATIFAYNLFNNLSLVLVVIFRRWVRPAVWFIFDRNKLVDRSDYDRLNRRLNQFKEELSAATKERDEAIDERKKLVNSNSELALKFTQVVEEKNQLAVEQTKPHIEVDRLKYENDILYKDKEQLTTTLSTVTSELEQLRNSGQGQRQGLLIAFARYGWDGEYIDVAETISKLLQSGNSFSVKNDVLGGDPMKYAIKTLNVVYLLGDAKRTFDAVEEDNVTFDGSVLHSVPTEGSINNRVRIGNIPRLAGIFSGEWKLTCTLPNATKKEERVTINSRGEYFANGKHTYYLRMIEISENESVVFFRKVDLRQGTPVKENLKRTTKDTFEGSDSKGNRLVYQREYQVVKI